MKTGDIVVCLNGGFSLFIWEGRKYTILESWHKDSIIDGARQEFVSLVELQHVRGGNSFYAERFQKAMP
jgi:hypothetical protein